MPRTMYLWTSSTSLREYIPAQLWMFKASSSASQRMDLKFLLLSFVRGLQPPPVWMRVITGWWSVVLSYSTLEDDSGKPLV
jgi:hypothetical protein